MSHLELFRYWVKLLHAEADGKLSVSDTVELERLSKNPAFRELRKKLKDRDYISMQLLKYDQFDDEMAYCDFCERAGIKWPKRSMRSRIYVVSGIAAVIVLIIGITWLYCMNMGDYYSMKLAQQCRPALNKITLKLADGEQIILEKPTECDIDGVGKLFYGENGVQYELKEQLPVQEEQYNELSVPYGCKCNITLDDGTKVWLNAGSILSYPVKFLGNRRYVKLSGEAFFDVTYHPEMPFVVEANKTTMTVRGTKFNVHDFENETVASTTLIEGCVEVSNGRETVTLSPGMQSQLHDGEEGLLIREVDTSFCTAWLEDKIAFLNAGLQEIASEIQRWYSVDVKIKVDPEAYAMTGKIPKTYSLAEVIGLLESISDLVFIMVDERTLLIDRQ